MPELVIGRALFVVLENGVGFLGLLEMLLRVSIIQITVRMVLHRQLAIGLFELSFVNVSLNSKHFVIVAFCHLKKFAEDYFVCSRFEAERILIQA